MRPFRRAADRTRLQELEAVIGEARTLIDAVPDTSVGPLNLAMDAARTAAMERLRIVTRNRPPDKSRRAR